MSMHDPPHPGEFLREVYLEPLDLSLRRLAAVLEVSPSTLSRVASGRSSVTPEMALRLAKALGRSAESWMALQSQFDLWQARQTADLSGVETIDASAA